MTHRGPTNWTMRDPAGLSFQERRVLELLRAGKTTLEIASVMGLSRSSTYTYVARILRKTETHHRRELIAKVPSWVPANALEEEIDSAVSRGEQ